jgi:hypothetical protein
LSLREALNLTFLKHILGIAALFLTTGGVVYAHPYSDECYLHGHRIYLVPGLNYPRQQWASWGITCRQPKVEGIEGTEAATGMVDRPAEWCGWWMRQHLGGHYGPEFNTAINWLRVGHPLDGPRPGAIGVQAHHVFQVIQVVGPEEVLAISGNDHGAVRTRVRSTAAVIGWRGVGEEGVSTASTTPKPRDEKIIRISTPAPQVGNETAPDGDY